MVKNLFKKKKEEVQLEKFYDENNKLIRIVCKVPVGNLSKKDAEKTIDELMLLYDNGKIYEFFRKLKRDERKEKLKKIYE